MVLRITRHSVDEDRARCLRKVYGSNVLIVSTDQVSFRGDAVGAVREAVERVETTYSSRIVAIEAQAPIPVLIALLDRQQGIGIPLIRAEFKRDEQGRAFVYGRDDEGRDLLKFSHYNVLERIEFVTRRLAPVE